mgnify:CR=1 FL=1
MTEIVADIIKPFGPSIFKVKIPKQIVDDLNHYVDNIVANETKANQLNYGNQLIGDVTQEFKLEKKLDTIHTVKKNYVLISTYEEHHSFIETLMQQKTVAFDTETTSLEIEDATLLGISFSFNYNEGYYCSLKDDENQHILN